MKIKKFIITLSFIAVLIFSSSLNVFAAAVFQTNFHLNTYASKIHSFTSKQSGELCVANYSEATISISAFEGNRCVGSKTIKPYEVGIFGDISKGKTIELIGGTTGKPGIHSLRITY